MNASPPAPVPRRLAAVAVGLGALGCVTVAACDRSPPPGDDGPLPAASTEPEPRAQAGVPELPSALQPAPAPVEPEQTPEAPPYTGPYFAITRSSTGVYAEPAFSRKLKIGYARSGGRARVHAEPIEKDNCKGGWYRVVEGGYICGNDGTTDLESPKARFAVTAPAIDDVLPYRYARNAKNGTPLYKSVPSKEQMAQYEPYLAEKKATNKKGGADTKKEKSESTQSATTRAASVSSKQAAETRAVATQKPSPSAAAKAEREGAATAPAAGGNDLAAGDAGSRAADAATPKTPWWRQQDVDDKLHTVSLDQLASESDDILAKRMVKGFYVAIDRVFNWNGRSWYKTTRGLVAPADRFWQTEGSDFKGVELDESWKLPLGWVYGWQKSKPTYEFDPDTKKIKPAGTVKHFAAVNLTGESIEVGKRRYLATVDGTYMRESDLRVTQPGPAPADLEPGERWVDVNLSTQTLVAFVGTRPVYATLLSSGKESKEKAKDHRTPTGEFRIREKHLTTTMDGDGSAAGDLPYSIEDVPYVMYFYRAYALHGAFWHRNYGVRMSHGCVNLAPLDAKHLFFFTDPPVPEGWHGAWSTKDKPGSRVVVHE